MSNINYVTYVQNYFKGFLACVFTRAILKISLRDFRSRGLANCVWYLSVNNFSGDNCDYRDVMTCLSDVFLATGYTYDGDVNTASDVREIMMLYDDALASRDQFCR